MSRYSDYDDDEAFPGQSELYQANLTRALKGRRGRKFLADLREALLALPEPKLIEGALCTVGAPSRREAIVAEETATWAAIDERWRPPTPDLEFARDLDEHVERDGEGVCAIGAYLWHKQVKAGADPGEAFASLPLVLGTADGGLSETAALAREAGVVSAVAWEVAYLNDERFGAKTAAARHAAVLAWIDKQLGEPAHA